MTNDTQEEVKEEQKEKPFWCVRTLPNEVFSESDLRIMDRQEESYLNSFAD